MIDNEWCSNQICVMPLFGGPADGQWVALRAFVSGKYTCGATTYTVHVMRPMSVDSTQLHDDPDNPGVIHGPVLWFALAEEGLTAITGNDVMAAYGLPEGVSHV